MKWRICKLKLNMFLSWCCFAVLALAIIFFLKNSITILNERQNQIKEKIEKLEKCAEKAEEHQNKTDNILTRLKTCVENIKRELDKRK